MNGGTILTTVFKLDSNRDPKQVINNYLKWSSFILENKDLDVVSVRIITYFNKDEAQFYAVLGKEALIKIKESQERKGMIGAMRDHCKGKRPEIVIDFCAISINL